MECGQGCSQAITLLQVFTPSEQKILIVMDHITQTESSKEEGGSLRVKQGLDKEVWGQTRLYLLVWRQSPEQGGLLHPHPHEKPLLKSHRIRLWLLWFLNGLEFCWVDAFLWHMKHYTNYTTCSVTVSFPPYPFYRWIHGSRLHWGSDRTKDKTYIFHP